MTQGNADIGSASLDYTVFAVISSFSKSVHLLKWQYLSRLTMEIINIATLEGGHFTK